MSNQRGGSAILVILVLVLLLALGGGGYFYLQQKQQQALPPLTSFDHIDLNEEVVVFLFQKIPRLYSRIVQLNVELAAIAAELERIAVLEDEYPTGKRYVQAERSMWLKLQKSLETSVMTLEKRIESFYVAYMVNQEKGKTLIIESLEDLLSKTDSVLTESQNETRRLKVQTSTSLIDRLKGLF